MFFSKPYKENEYNFADNNKNTNATNVKSFFSSIGSKLKTFVAEEQQTISQFLADNPSATTDTKPSDKQETVLLPPWLDIPTDDPRVFNEVKTQILNLTQSKRNFLNAPPDDVVFTFNFDTWLPLAQVCLQTDPMLSKVRFYLVPKYIREPQFWRNYFFRVHLIKEAYGVNKKVSAPANIVTTTNSDQPAESKNTTAPSTTNETATAPQKVQEDVSISRPRSTTEEFVSDTFSDPLPVATLQKELGQLGLSPSSSAFDAAIQKEIESSLPATKENENIELSSLDDAWEEQLKKELEEE